MTSNWTARPQRLSDAGRLALEAEEGLRLTAYQDRGGVWTIGYGHTGPEVHRGLTWSRAEADAALAADVAFAESAVSGAVKAALHQHEFDALVSFVYNVGVGAFRGSTLVARLAQSPADFAGAAAEFTKWVHVAGVFAPGLLARRTREMLRFVGYGVGA